MLMFRVSSASLAILLGWLAPACFGQRITFQDVQLLLQQRNLFVPNPNRELQQAECASLMETANECLDSKIAENEQEECTQCFIDAFNAVMKNNIGSDTVECTDFDALICTSAESTCPCMRPCAYEWGEYTECQVKADLADLGYTYYSSCSGMTCQSSSFSSSGGGGGSGLGYLAAAVLVPAFALI